jgi:hypothetical protein
MTAAQKTAKDKFKKAIAYRTKTGVSLKEAFAHVYGKKVGAIKKKAAPKKKAAVKKAEAKKKAAPKKKAAAKKAAPVKAAPAKTTVKKYNSITTVSGVKKAAAKKVTGSHKDTKSHNVNIRVVSGVKDLQKLHYNIYDLIKMVEKERASLKQKIIFNGKLGESFYTKPEIALFRKEIIKLNKRILALKKLAKEQERTEKYF